MSNSSDKTLSPFVSPLIALLVTFLVMQYYIVSAPYIIHSLGGDGVKNYFSYTWHALRGNGWWFDGMNYPYGEHIVYTDGLPFLSVPLSFFKEYLDVGIVSSILNISMALSFYLGIIFLTRTLKRLNVPELWSVVFASLVITMSPQLDRMGSHYALSYVCVVPMLLYWSVLYYQKESYKYVLYVFVLCSIMMFAHPYFLAYCLGWCVFYAFGYWLFVKRSSSEKLKHVLSVLIAPILSMLLLKTVMTITDPVIDRPVAPMGTLSACTTGLDIFTTAKSIYWVELQQLGLVQELATNVEGAAYLGFVPLLLIIVMIVLLVISLLRKRKFNVDRKERLLIVIALSTLLVAMGVPFVWGMDWLLDYISAFRQFRSLGRFAQLYYYVGNVLVVVFLYKWYVLNKHRRFKLAVIAVAALFVVWFAEATSYALNFRTQSKAFSSNYDFFYSKIEDKNWNEFLATTKYTPQSFQAVTAIPFVHIGSEKVSFHEHVWGFTIATKAAMQLGIPIVDANMSRSSWSQTFDQIKIQSGSFVEKPILKDINDKRPFLILSFPDRNPTSDEAFLTSISDSLGEFSHAVVYALYPDSLKSAMLTAKEKIEGITSVLDGGDTSVLNCDYHVEHFSKVGMPEKNSLDECLVNNGEHEGFLYDIDVSNYDKSRSYELSYWTLWNDYDYNSPSIEVIFWEDKSIVSRKEVKSIASDDNFDMWFRSAIFFNIPDNASKISLWTFNNNKHKYLAMDEIQLRVAEDTIVSSGGESRCIVNNHILRK